MQKTIAFILTLLFTLFLCSCTAKAPLNPEIPDETAATSATTIPTETEETPEYIPVREPLVSVCLPVQTEQYYAEDGTLLVSSHIQAMELTIQEPQIANRVIVDFLNRVDPVSQNVEGLYRTAQQNYNPDVPWTPYLSQLIYTPTRLDPGVLSLFGTNITAAGTSHTDKACVSANYNLITGDVLTLGSIIAHVDQLDTLCDLVIQALEIQKEEKQLYSDYKKTVIARFAADESTNEQWFFTDTGLCFYFSPYEIAPYHSGTVLAEIPYDSLLGILDDNFFPAERMTTSGKLSIDSFSDSSTADVAHYIEAVLAKDARMLVIRGDDPVQNIRFLTELNGETVTVFCAYGLYSDEAIVLEATDEQLESIRILYDADGMTFELSPMS